MNMVHTFVERYGVRLGRIFIGLLFLVSGIGLLLNFPAFKGMIPALFPMATVVAIIALVMKIGGGLSLTLGIRVRLGAYALILFTLLTILFVHLKGTLAGDQMELVMTLKNLALIGGLLLVAKSAPMS